jgi:hypothetical protein
VKALTINYLVKRNPEMNTQQAKLTKLIKLTVLGAVLASLAACEVLVVGGVVAGAAMVATDRRTSGAQLDDEGIELRASSRLRDRFGEKGHFNVTSFNRRVLITGEVGNTPDKQAAELLVSQVENVKIVVNELTLAPMTSTLSERSNDTYLTGFGSRGTFRSQRCTVCSLQSGNRTQRGVFDGSCDRARSETWRRSCQWCSRRGESRAQF